MKTHDHGHDIQPKPHVHKRLFVALGCLALLAISAPGCDLEVADDMSDVNERALLEGSDIFEAFANPVSEDDATALTDADGQPLPTMLEPVVQTKQSLIAGDQFSDILVIDSWCPHPLQVAIYANYLGWWSMHAWYQFRTYERAVIDAMSSNQFVYFYAETTDGSNIVWSGQTPLYVPGSGWYNFDEWDTGPTFGTKTLQLFC